MRTIIIILFSLSPFIASAQPGKLTLEQAVDIALKNNKGIKAASYEVEYQKQLKKTSFDLPKTNVSLTYGQYNSYVKNDNNITVSQTIPFTALGSQGALNRELVASTELKKAATENELVYQVKQVYYQLAFAQARHDLLLQQDSIYEGFLKSASLRYKTGETNLLEQTTAETQRNEVKNQLRQSEATMLVLRTQLKTLLSTEELPDISENTLREIEFRDLADTTAIAANPSLAYMRQQVEVAQSQKKVEAAKFAPDLLVGFFSQTLIGSPNSENGGSATSSDRFTGFQVGISIPLWFVPHQGRVKAAAYNQQAAQSNYQYYQTTLKGQLQQAAQQYAQNKNSLEYYQTSALPNADLILKQSEAAFRNGEIGYVEYFLGLRNALAIKEGYLQTLNNYNQSIIYIEFLSGNK
jgi:cobalt-zinc-cadmium resistance protein CzcA